MIFSVPMQECWAALGSVERSTLLHHFLADGIEETAFVFEFLPDSWLWNLKCMYIIIYIYIYVCVSK